MFSIQAMLEGANVATRTDVFSSIIKKSILAYNGNKEI